MTPEFLSSLDEWSVVQWIGMGAVVLTLAMLIGTNIGNYVADAATNNDWRPWKWEED